MTDDVDIIERTVEINAPAERVWDLVAEPGWDINDGAIVAHRIDRDGDLSYVHDEKHGRFAFATVSLDRPRYAAFRWLDNPDAADSASTLVEFTITALAADSVTLTVVESGFASLPGSALDRRRRWEENTEGWTLELGLARGLLEQHSVAVPVS